MTSHSKTAKRAHSWPAAPLHRAHGGLRAVTQTQLMQDAFDVNLRRARRHTELLRHLRIAQATRQQRQHFLLTRGEPRLAL